MGTTQFLFQAFVYLAAAVITVPVALRLGFGSVLGYLIAGVIIGPFALDLVSVNTAHVMHFAEFGIVMMLFIVGLELRPSMLWEMRKPLFMVGGLQVVITTLVIFLIAKLYGANTASAIAIGLIFTASSTAIVLQMLQEKGWIKLSTGNTVFAILLFQDIAVIPMLAIFPLLGTISPHAITTHNESTAIVKALVILAVILAIVNGGRYVIRPVFKFIASSKLHETFTALALLLIVATTLLMNYIGLSPAMGAFIAGVVLAESEYKHELEANIEPFKGLLLGLFFISVGTNIDFNVIYNHLSMILKMVVLLIGAKFLVLFCLGKILDKKIKDILLVSLILAQGGEFCFVLISYANQYLIFTDEFSRELVAVVALSMMMTPLIMLIYDKCLLKIFNDGDSPETNVVNQDNQVIIAGFGRVGQIIYRFLLANGFDSTILDLDSQQIDLVSKFGHKVFYGDASRMDLLRLAGLKDAKLLVVAINDGVKALKIATMVRQAYPHIKILIRVRSRTEAYEALNLGFDFDDIYRETFDSALNIARDSLQHLGLSLTNIDSTLQDFKKLDKEGLKAMSPYYKGKMDDEYVNQAKLNREQLERVLKNDLDNA
ncbi:MAG: monovalent cation:proton antiporter-2 (CPA2) family protein [Burkholderiales bacterium]|nr:monovalent cation:proton antiporter-2 (CPA2) family protein [Burkholderiales bacterium]